jgi:hypothetical protein
LTCLSRNMFYFTLSRVYVSGAEPANFQLSFRLFQKIIASKFGICLSCNGRARFYGPVA